MLFPGVKIEYGSVFIQQQQGQIIKSSGLVTALSTGFCIWLQMLCLIPWSIFGGILKGSSSFKFFSHSSERVCSYIPNISKTMNLIVEKASFICSIYIPKCFFKEFFQAFLK
jgi:hypothetical protein